jgi:phage-related minor tail protein
MASKNIKGIVIEVGGNTTKLENALKSVDKQVYSLNSDLKAVNQALKLDPKNTELLSQKYDILKRNIEATKDRLNTLKEAQRQMGDYSKLTEEQKKQYTQLSLEIAKGEDALKKMNKELQASSKIDLSKLQSGLKKVGEVALDVSKKLLQVSTAIGGALASVVGLGVKSYADLEQNIGGIQKLFGDSADDLIKKSKEAYKTAGLSANQYMETATSFSASLLKGLGGDTKQAVALTDRAIQDMSDNANTFGTSMEEVMNVYKALSKEQFTTLDNLKLGYAGTKEGMKQLIADASSYTDIQKELGISVDASNMSFDNMINAISVIQKHLNITGTTMKEAEGTITGSINQMKASFENFINGSGSPEELSKSILNVVRNISKAVKKLAPDILQGIVELISTLIPEIGKILIQNIPLLLDSISKMIDDLLTLLTSNTESLQKAITELINKIVEFITLNLPKILQIALTLIITLAKGLADSLKDPNFISSIVNCVITICDVIVENLPLIIDVAVQIIVALIEGLSSDEGIGKLVEYIPELVIKVVEALIKAIPLIVGAIPKIFDAIIQMAVRSSIRTIQLGKDIIKWIIDGIGSFLGKLGEKAGEIIETIKEEITKLPDKAKQWGKDMVQGLIDGMKSMLGGLGKTASNLGSKIKEFLHFSRPDTGPLRDYETWMPDFVEGLAKGIEKSSYLVENASLGLANDMTNSILGNTSKALKGLNSGINASLNPNINPSYSYDLNYKLMAQAMKEALQEVQVELDDRELGRFVDKQVSEEVYS